MFHVVLMFKHVASLIINLHNLSTAGRVAQYNTVLYMKSFN